MPPAPGGVIDLCAGPGGWDLALRRLLGRDAHGIELDADACATRSSARLLTTQADISLLDPRDWHDIEGLLASPPCTAFSAAGKREGRQHIDALCAAIRAGDWSALRGESQAVWLILEVGRWIEHLLTRDPRGLQVVESVLPAWRAYTEWLDTRGWYTWAGVLSAEQFGVPQCRVRSFLLAHRDHPVGPPTPTHQRYEGKRSQHRLGLLAPFITMAEALGWGATERPYATIAASRTTGGPDREKVGGSGARAAMYAEQDEGRWAYDRPATAVCGDPRLSPPGFRGLPDDYEPDGTYTGDRSMDRAIRITLQEAMILQGFPPDFPVQGRTEQSKFRQIGNAVPPPLAAAVLGSLLRLPIRS